MPLAPEERLARLSEAEQHRIFVFMQAGEVDLNQRLTELRATSDWTATRLAEIKDQLHRALTAMDEGARDWSGTATRNVYQASMELADENLKQAINADFDMSMFFDAPIHLEAIQALATATYTPFQDYLGQIGRRVDDDLRRMALERARGSLLGVTTRGGMEVRLKRDMKAAGWTDFTDKAGRHWDLKRYTEMVSRTTVRACETEGTANRLAQMGCKLAIISRHSTVSARAAAKGSSATACDVCSAWEDQIVDLGGGSSPVYGSPEGGAGKGAYPSVEDARTAGVWHPNCRHNLLPYVPDIREQINSLEDQLGLPRTDYGTKPPVAAPEPQAKPKKVKGDDPIKAIKAEADKLQAMMAKAADPGDPTTWDDCVRQTQKVGSLVHDQGDQAAAAARLKMRQAEEDRTAANADAADAMAKLRGSREQQALYDHMMKRPQVPGYDAPPGSMEKWRKDTDRWREEHNAIQKAYNDAGDRLGLTAAQERARMAGKAITDAQTEVGQAYYDVLGRVRQFGTDQKSIAWDKTPKKVQQIVMDKVAPRYPKAWWDKAGPIRYSQIRTRCFYEDWKHWARIGRDGDAGVHETAHHWQRKIPGLWDMERAFWTTRTTGADGTQEPTVRLSRLLPGKGYRPYEVTKPDRWPHPYMGKVYDEGPREVITMGYDALSEGEAWLDDPTQRDYLDFLLGTLGGV